MDIIKDVCLGTFGDISCFSFFGNKVITSGEGGAILTNDPNLANTCKELRDHGMSSVKKYHHVALGYNYRMTNMQAAIGFAQLEKIDEILSIRKAQMDYYYDKLKTVSGVQSRLFKDWCTPVHWLLTITLDPKFERDNVIAKMKGHGVECRPMINPVHHAVYLRDNYSDDQFPVSVDISSRSLHLPSSNKINEQDIEYIIDALKKSLQ